SGGVVKFFDITNKNAPVALGQYTPNSITIPHNAFIIGDRCHVSWYSLGYRCIDISNPNNPVEIASYDTYNGTTNSYDGCWGCYPFLPSGNILASDQSTGLYVIALNISDIQIAHTPLPDTQNEDGPYTVTATATSTSPIGSMNLSWRQGNSGAFTTVAMTPTGNPNEYSAGIPGHDAVTTLQYHIDATDASSSRREPASGEHDFLIGTVTQVFYDGFETDLGWTHGTTGVQDDWQRGSPAGQSGTSGGIPWQDPTGAFAGSNIWANDLGGTGFNGSYQNNNANWLQSPGIATGGVQGLRLRFWRWLELAAGDVGTILVNGNNVYTSPAGGINDGSWQFVDIDISSISNGTSSLQVRFELTTNGTIVSGGWGIDELEIATVSDCAPPLLYGNATAGTPGLPTIAKPQPASVGSVTTIEGGNVLASAPAFLVLNLFDDNQSVFGITALVQSGGPTQLAFASALGQLSYPFTVPNNPSLDNLYIYGQIVSVDAGGPMGLAATQGLRFRVCAQ
ncbi:MAG: hypothetical protein KDE27_19685, partial [Planctomycetes bacterium]|nr:hypothetical protein [Planctomycetota bacterium]